LSGFRIGIDLGGTKIESILLAGDGDLCARQRTETPKTYDGVMAALASHVDSLRSKAGGEVSIGIGTPGSISPATGLMRNANSTFLNGRPFREDVCAALRQEVRIANDANCFALSEAQDGAGKGANVVFGVILGTGVGGGVVINGRILEGASGIGGEWGHSPLPWPGSAEMFGPACWCGKHGCLETWLSGPAWQRWHKETFNQDLGPAAIADRAAAGDAIARTSLERYADRLARGLATVINVIDPDIIVLGGGVSNVMALYDGVSQRLPAYVFSDHVAVRVVPNLHGDSSGVRGAAWLWPLEGAR